LLTLPCDGGPGQLLVDTVHDRTVHDSHSAVKSIVQSHPLLHIAHTRNVLSLPQVVPLRLHLHSELNEGIVRNRIREVRESKGLKPWQVAEMIGRDRSTISRLETGKQAATQRDLTDIAKALGVNPLDLITDAPVAQTERERALLELIRGLDDRAADALIASAQAMRPCRKAG
jgi:transcriptional regulator with XRE-family HTH domain